jgi:sulfite oxidase
MRLNMSAVSAKKSYRPLPFILSQPEPAMGKHPAIIVRKDKPYNAEPPAALLVETHCTPLELFFVRNHGAVPQVDANSFRLSVTGAVRKPLRMSVHELRSKFPKETITATLQCAGNRRTDFFSLGPIPDEVPWTAQALGTATWGGVALAEVLRAAELTDDVKHIAFGGLDEVEKEGARFGFGGSISREKAMNPEVIVAYEMDGKPLAPTHGFPLRAVVPGYLGARSVKWLSNINAQIEPSDNYFQVHAYKIFPPQVQAETADWGKGTVLEEMPVNSAICIPHPGDTLPAGPVEIRGYAIGKGGDRIEEVQFSRDNGATWMTAELQGGNRWAWYFWRIAMEFCAGSYGLAVRARDASGNTQPNDIRSVWNFKGYANNAWHRVRVHVV